VTAVRDATFDVATLSRREIIVTMLGLLLGLFLAGLDQTIVAAALPAIARDFGGLETMTWVVTAYLVSSTAATPIYGRLSDLFGRRVIVLSSVAVFVTASVLCGLSQNLPELIAARALQGVGGGGLRSMALVVIADLVPPGDRGRYQGYFAGTMTTANALGPILGGTLAQNLSWQWIFWINLPIGVAAWILSSRHLARLPASSGKARVDWIGALLIVAAVTLVLVGIGGAGGPASGACHHIDMLTGAAVCIAMLLWCERRAEEPMIPLRLFANPVFVAGVAVMSLMSALIVGLIVIIPLDYELVAGFGSGAAGLRMIPLTSGTAVGSLLAGCFVSRTGRYRAFPAIGASAASLTCLSLAQIGLGRSLLFDVISTGLLGIAAGFQISPVSVAVQNALARDETGIGTGALLLFRSLAGAIGAAIFIAVLAGAASDHEPAGLALELLRHFPPANIADGSTMATAETLIRVREALADGVSRVFLIGAILMGLSLVAALCLPERPLRRSIA
jgi:EmrB/QacA subfamily drug resistance transporter